MKVKIRALNVIISLLLMCSQQDSTFLSRYAYVRFADNSKYAAWYHHYDINIIINHCCMESAQE
jgi:hypothetical protein